MIEVGEKVTFRNVNVLAGVRSLQLEIMRYTFS